MELETQLLLAKELKYFNGEQIFNKIDEVAKLLNGLIQSRRKKLDFKNFLIYFSFITHYLLSTTRYLLLSFITHYLLFTTRYLLFPTCYLLLTTNLIFAAFQNTAWSVSAESMGGVAVAYSNEPFGVFYNPANIVNVETKSFQIAYLKPYLALENVDINLNNIAFVLPTKYVSLSAAVGMYNVNNLYYETTSIFSFSTVLKKFFDNLPYISIGTNLKFLTKGYKFDNEILNRQPELKNKNSTTVFSTDIGLTTKMLKDKLSLALAVKDVNQPNVAIVSSEDIVPLTVSFGGIYNIGDIKTILYFEDFTIGCELRYRNQTWGTTQTKLFYGIGFQTYLNFHTIAIRAGINKESVNFGFGYNGIKLSQKVFMNIQYGFGLSTIIFDSYGTHRISFEIRF